MLSAYKHRLVSEGKITIKVRVKTAAKKDEILGKMADATLNIAVAAVPEQGKANARLITFLAQEFGVKKHNVEIISGRTAKLKIIKLIKSAF